MSGTYACETGPISPILKDCFVLVWLYLTNPQRYIGHAIKAL